MSSLNRKMREEMRGGVQGGISKQPAQEGGGTGV